MEDKDTPLPFHYLDTLETQGQHLTVKIQKFFTTFPTFSGANSMDLQPGQHILCVYGDNFLQMVCKLKPILLI